MTIDEAIKIVRGESVGYPVSCDEQINAAECVADYAEKYLKQKEAWEKVKQDLYKFASDSFDAECAECYRIALRCVEGHLREVSE